MFVFKVYLATQGRLPATHECSVYYLHGWRSIFHAEIMAY
jgi:hypothetical protein